MLGFHNNSFDPRTLLDLETAFDEAWFNAQIDWQHDSEAERIGAVCLAAARLRDGALKGVIPTAAWREPD